MTTRANLKIESLGLDWHEAVQLFRGADGYPTAVLPSLVKAYEWSGGGWEAGRARKVAAYICASSYVPAHRVGDYDMPPYVPYIPEVGLCPRSDIDWYYILYLINDLNGAMGEKPRWNIAIYRPNKEFWDDPIASNLIRIARGEIHEMAERAAEIEQSAYKEVGA